MSGTVSDDFATTNANNNGLTVTEVTVNSNNPYQPINDSKAVTDLIAASSATTAGAVKVILASGSFVAIEVLAKQAAANTGVASSSSAGSGLGKTSNQAAEAAAVDNSANPTSDTNGYASA